MKMLFKNSNSMQLPAIITLSYQSCLNADSLKFDNLTFLPLIILDIKYENVTQILETSNAHLGLRFHSGKNKLLHRLLLNMSF